MAITTIAGAVAAKKALEKVVEDTYELGKGKIKDKIKLWRAKSTIQTLYKKLSHVRKVKTIWQAEKEVDLQKFYYPSKVKIGDKEKVINQLEDLEYKGNVVIEGTIGQGKSIFFRYLTSQETLKGKAIPIFVELRRIKDDESIVAHLIDELRSLGLEVDEHTLLFLAEHGKIILFLDAFDEVKDIQRATLINEIERLIKQNENLRVLISSRPDSGIAASPFFRVFNMCPLRGGEYKKVIGHMVKDLKTASQLVKGIEHSKEGIESVLTTPLMVALVVVRYRIEQTIPENAIAFYDGLFNLLLVRHDKLKPGYIRPRKSKLGDTALRQVFNGICFLTRKVNKGVFGITGLQEYTEEAIRISGRESEPDKVLCDIMDITCLILQEGSECKFIHKSVQEYHSACFIKEQPDESATRFYQAVHYRWHNWEQELEFLSSIDRYRFLKFFLMPEAIQTLSLEGTSIPSKWKPSSSEILRLIQITRLGFDELKEIRIDSVITQGGKNWAFEKIVRSHFVSDLFKLGFKSLNKELSNKNSLLKNKITHSEDFYEIKLLDVVKAGYMSNEVKVIAEGVWKTIHAELIKAQRFVEHAESTRDVFEL